MMISPSVGSAGTASSVTAWASAMVTLIPGAILIFGAASALPPPELAVEELG